MEMKTARLAKAPSAVAMRDEMTFGQKVCWTKMTCVFFALTLTSCDTIRSIKSDIASSRDFNRKVRCETYASKIEQDNKGSSKDESYSIERIFYSAKRNSCVCILIFSAQGDKLKAVQTFDVLTKEDLGTQTYYGYPQLDNLPKDVEAQVKSLE